MQVWVLGKRYHHKTLVAAALKHVCIHSPWQLDQTETLQYIPFDMSGRSTGRLCWRKWSALSNKWWLEAYGRTGSRALAEQEVLEAGSCPTKWRCRHSGENAVSREGFARNGRELVQKARDNTRCRSVFVHTVRTTGCCCRWADFFYGDELQLVPITINAQQGPIVTQLKRFEDPRVFFWMLSSVSGKRCTLLEVAILADENSSRLRLT